MTFLSSLPTISARRQPVVNACDLSQLAKRTGRRRSIAAWWDIGLCRPVFQLAGGKVGHDLVVALLEQAGKLSLVGQELLFGNLIRRLMAAEGQQKAREGDDRL